MNEPEIKIIEMISSAIYGRQMYFYQDDGIWYNKCKNKEMATEGILIDLLYEVEYMAERIEHDL